MSNTDLVSIDLGRYCARIGYRGPLDGSLDTLANLIEHHLAAIPFENIDVLLARPVDISAAAIEGKLVGRGRGGYCFEHNRLFKRVLVTLGFEVENLAARVLWGRHESDPPRPRTHMALRAIVEGEPWLVDVGFGGSVPVRPLRFAETGPQPTPHETFRLERQCGGVIVALQAGEVWRALYELSEAPLLDVDYEPLNWYTSAHPASPFKQHLMVARVTPEARFSLMDARLTIRHRDGTHDQRMLKPDELEATLADIFGLIVEPEWRPLLARFAAAR